LVAFLKRQLGQKKSLPAGPQLTFLYNDVAKKVFIRKCKCTTEKFNMYKRMIVLTKLEVFKTFHEVEIFIMLKCFGKFKINLFYGRRILAK